MAQSLSISGQLMLGIRFFDLRVSQGRMEQSEAGWLNGNIHDDSSLRPAAHPMAACCNDGMTPNGDVAFFVSHGLACVELSEGRI